MRLLFGIVAIGIGYLSTSISYDVISKVENPDRRMIVRGAERSHNVIPYRFLSPDEDPPIEITEQYKEEIKKSKEVLDKPEMAMILDYNVYTHNGTKSLDYKTGSFDKSEDSYLYKLEQISIIQNSKWLMYLDDNDKLMVVKNREKKETTEIISFDVAINACKSINREEVGNNYKYTLELKEHMARIYSVIEIHTTRSKFTPVKIVFYYANSSSYVLENGEEVKDKLKMEIEYKEINFSTKKSFNTDTYFSEDNKGDLKVKSEYSEYKLIDQRLYK